MNKTAISLAGLLLVLPWATFAADWTDKISMKGDFRYRHDYTKEEISGKPEDFERHRHRMRLRLSVIGQVNDSIEMTTRLATGSTAVADTTSTNQTFDDYYSRKGIFLDLAYMNWKASDSVGVWAGKTPNPFYFVGGNDLIFDSDLTPEGAALKYKQSFGSVEVMLNTAATWLDERYSSATGDDNDVGLVGAQLVGNYKAESFNVLLGYAHYSFANIKNAPVDAAAVKGNSATTTAGTTRYDQDYRIHAFSMEIGTSVASVPVSLFGEVVSNETGYNYKPGSIAGLKINKLKDEGSWAFALDRRELEKDAVLGALTDGDAGGGGTNVRGWRSSAQYQFAKNANVSVSYYEFEKAISDPKTLRFKKAFLDLNLNF